MQLCLVIRINGMQQLHNTMGKPASEQALTILASMLVPKINAVLEHGRISAQFRQINFEQGVCRTCFELASVNDLLNDPEFAQQILLAAETELMAAAKQVFGYATSQLANPQIVLLTQEQAQNSQATEQAFAERYQHQPDNNDSAQQQLTRLINGTGPRVFLQPIVDARQPELPIIGYEALARGPINSQIERADQLFDTARRCGLLPELEKSCIRAAIKLLPQMPSNQILSVNSSSGILFDQEISRLLSQRNLWIELTEHLPLGEARQLNNQLELLKAGGAKIALDDTGCGYADMQAAQELQPKVVKLCITIIRALDGNNAVIEQLEQTIGQLHQLGCLVLAEGIETSGQLELMQRLGIDYVQGWHLGRPAPADEVL